MSIAPKLPVQLPQLPPQWWMPAANTNAELTSLEVAKHMGWRGVVGTAAKTAATEGIGTTLWGIARIGLPILTLGLVMEGDGSRKSLRANDFPKPQPDSKYLTHVDLDFLKQQKQLAELSGNKSLAQLLNILIAQRGADLIPAQFPGQKFVTGALNMIASAEGGDSAAPADATMSAEEWGARDRLKSQDPAIQWDGWKALYRLNPAAAKQITQADLGPPAPFIAGTEGVARYVLRTKHPWRKANTEVATWLSREGSRQEVPLDIRGIRPAHSLLDFMPEPLSQTYDHSPIMAYYFKRLQDLRKYYPSAAVYLDYFVNQSYTGNWTPIVILQLPSGIQIVHNGHHRVAALIKAAREGVIPEHWLKQVPVELLVIKDDFPIPEPVFLQIYAPAHTLTLDDLLPPHIPQPR